MSSFIVMNGCLLNVGFGSPPPSDIKIQENEEFPVDIRYLFIHKFMLHIANNGNVEVSNTSDLTRKEAVTLLRMAIGHNQLTHGHMLLGS